MRSALLLFAALLAAGEDWPGKRGPCDDWTAPAPAAFPGRGGHEAWRRQVGAGCSGIAVAQGLAITVGNAGGSDTVWALDAATGAERWRVSYPQRLEPRGYEGGPNATPLIADGRVVVCSRQGRLLCLALVDGRELWCRELTADGVRQPNYGFSSAPVVRDGVLALNIGTHGRAYALADGRPLWQSGAVADGYATPAFADIGGAPAVLTFTRAAVSAARLADGTRLWSTPWVVKHAIADPLVLGGRVLATHGYGSGSIMLALADGTREAGFPQQAFLGVLYPPVPRDSHLYGSSGDKQTAGEFRCLRAADGAVAWIDTSLGTGACVGVGPYLVFLGRRGLLAVLDADPAACRVRWRLPALTATCWTIPSVAAGRIYARDADGTLLCVEPLQGQ